MKVACIIRCKGSDYGGGSGGSSDGRGGGLRPPLPSPPPVTPALAPPAMPALALPRDSGALPPVTAALVTPAVGSFGHASARPPLPYRLRSPESSGPAIALSGNACRRPPR